MWSVDIFKKHLIISVTTEFRLESDSENKMDICEQKSCLFEDSTVTEIGENSELRN